MDTPASGYAYPDPAANSQDESYVNPALFTSPAWLAAVALKGFPHTREELIEVLDTMLWCHDKIQERVKSDWHYEVGALLDDIASIRANPQRFGEGQWGGGREPKAPDEPTRKMIRKFFLHGMTSEEIAVLLGIDQEMVDRYISERHMSDAGPQILALHKQGIPVTDIAVQVGVDRTYAKNVIASIGEQPINKRKYGVPDHLRRKIIRLYVEGELSQSQIATEVGLKLHDVKNVLRAARRDGTLPAVAS